VDYTSSIMRQFQLKFLQENQYLDEDYIVSGSNLAATRLIDEWPDWGNGPYSNIACIYGTLSSGKTHLATIWGRKSDAIWLNHSQIKNIALGQLSAECFILENIEEYLIYDSNLFHLFNFIIEQKKFLLITSQISPNLLNINLADLKSRLSAIQAIELPQPDDALINTLLIKMFSDRSLRINIDVINYIMTHTQRSFSKIAELVELIDCKSLAQKRNITVKLVREIMSPLEID
jgi:chromosomal replication initiation ATPase DnaA